jgi:succinate dehydrogenase/fumarate reductase iron-sulfur protein
MARKTAIFRILRYKPGHIDPPVYQDFEVHLTPAMSVLDALESIRLTQDAGLMYRHCCHHASCGTCACSIDGVPALACTTRIEVPASGIITLEPLAQHRCVGDLAVDTAAFFNAFDPRWAAIRKCEESPASRRPEGVDHLTRLENCIECGCCVSACPVMPETDSFLGPAVLAAVNNERRNRPREAATLLAFAARSDGTRRCKRHIACSRVCPSKVYPARQIADLQRAITDCPFRGTLST